MNDWKNMTIEELIQRDKELSQQISAQEKDWVCHPISSGFTPETLAQALADAKAVRAQALANAKQALKEAFESNGCIVETD